MSDDMVVDPREMSRAVNRATGCDGMAAAQQASPPEQAPVRHGAYCTQPLAMRCSACGVDMTCEFCDAREDGRCAIEVALLERRRPLYYRTIEAHGHHLPLQEQRIESCLFAELRAERAMRYVLERGDIRHMDGGVLTGVNAQLGRLWQDVKNLREELGLTAAGMEKLRSESETATKREFVAALQALGQAGAGQPGGEARDVEFTASDEDGGDGDGSGQRPAASGQHTATADGDGGDGS